MIRCPLCTKHFVIAWDWTWLADFARLVVDSVRLVQHKASQWRSLSISGTGHEEQSVAEKHASNIVDPKL